MESYRLDRTGDVPIAFDGEEIARCRGNGHNGVDLTRWHNLTLYRLPSGKYVLAIEYETLWQGESDHSTALVCDSSDEVRRLLCEYNATQMFVPRREYHQRDREMNELAISTLVSVYRYRVSQLLSGLEDFAETVS